MHDFKRVNFNYPRECRIRTAAHYQQVFSQAGCIRSSHFIIRYCNNSQQFPRLGVIVSKKVSKRAVVRNQIRRVVKECFRLRQSALPAIDMVVIAKPSASMKHKHNRKQEIKKCFIACMMPLTES